jgi:hypothetical protein
VSDPKTCSNCGDSTSDRMWDYAWVREVLCSACKRLYFDALDAVKRHFRDVVGMPSSVVRSAGLALPPMVVLRGEGEVGERCAEWVANASDATLLEGRNLGPKRLTVIRGFIPDRSKGTPSLREQLDSLREVILIQAIDLSAQSGSASVWYCRLCSQRGEYPGGGAWHAPHCLLAEKWEV